MKIHFNFSSFFLCVIISLRKGSKERNKSLEYNEMGDYYRLLTWLSTKKPARFHNFYKFVMWLVPSMSFILHYLELPNNYFYRTNKAIKPMIIVIIHQVKRNNYNENSLFFCIKARIFTILWFFPLSCFPIVRYQPKMSQLYISASKIVQDFWNKNGSLKTLTFSNSFDKKVWTRFLMSLSLHLSL